ncbi:hypothetical protein BE17_20480 [Sorangium cellulosum]|uniref:Uncharacterized protein n=1 Tax=Sorangium cellulosum TaxID=56 RepID=A0A150RB35_SORCE|nr:hypothetical protein BE17_20480 [Sorangium cellulosum]
MGGGDHLLQLEAPREFGAVAVHLVELSHVSPTSSVGAGSVVDREATAGIEVDAGELAIALAA